METAPKITILIVSLLMLNTCNAKIKMIQATIRHGDRYPESKKTLLAIYPNDPYFNDTWEPYGKMGLAEVSIVTYFYTSILYLLYFL